MRFIVLNPRQRPPSDVRARAVLEHDNWDDYTYKTLWVLHYADADGTMHEIGAVKIAHFGQPERTRTPLESQFSELPTNFFSLGQDETYYENLQTLGDSTRIGLLEALHDLAFDLELLDRAAQEDVTQTSLLRSITESEVRNQFHRLAMGGVRLSPYAFAYHPPVDTVAKQTRAPTSLSFTVTPQSKPPTNVHALIGRNGAGKSHLLNNIATALTQGETQSTGSIEFQPSGTSTEANRFANLVSVAFSAFDQFGPLPAGTQTKLPYSYIGLKTRPTSNTQATTLKGLAELTDEFVESATACAIEPRRSRWLRALTTLRSDPGFSDQIGEFIGEATEKKMRDRAARAFSRMSSGHKVVLLTMTRLVETVEEATLVLLDEPESHLHPPLLAAFVRALSDLLEDRNGVAVVATHSPVILQEVPRESAYKVRRVGDGLVASRPMIETFGENVGILTQEIFGLEVTSSGFHQTLQAAAASGESYADILAMFEGKLGLEARSLVRALTAARP